MSTGRILSRPARRITDLIISLLDWFFPPQCSICGKTPDLAPFICKSCFEKCQLFDECPDSAEHHDDHSADTVRAMFYFDEIIQKLVHGVKYQDKPYVGTFLGQQMGAYYRSGPIAQCDALIPVPLYAVRRRERTYNQSACIARGVASEWNVPVSGRIVKRCRNTHTQTKLNRQERRENIRNAFRVRKKARVPDCICIIDDVFTTGATTMELARILREAGAKKITILCLTTPRHKEKDKKIYLKAGGS